MSFGHAKLPARQKVILACMFGGIVFSMLILLGFEQYIYPYNPNGSNLLEVTQAGDVVQDGKRIAHLDANQVVKLALVDPTITADPLAINLTLHFADQAAAQAVQPELISIQGAGGAQFSWPSPDTLSIISPSYSPESYTALEVSATAGFFHPGIRWYAATAIERLSIYDGMALGLLIFLLCLWEMHRVLWRPPWKASQMLNTPPLGLTPIQLAILHHGTIEPIDFVAFFYYLAEQGYVQIVEQMGGVLFVRTGKREGLTPHELGLMTIIFPDDTRPTYLGELVTRLNEELFSAVVSQLYVEIYNTFNTRRFFKENPRIAHIRFKTLGIVFQATGLLTIIGYSVSLLAAYPVLLPVGMGVYLGGLYIYARAQRIVPYSPDAASYLTECAAFTQYLSAPHPIGSEAGQGDLFYRYVPYAISARVAPEWLARFENTPWFIPKWYANESEDIMDPATFVNRVAAASDMLSKVMVKIKDPNAD